MIRPEINVREPHAKKFGVSMSHTKILYYLQNTFSHIYIKYINS